MKLCKLVLRYKNVYGIEKQKEVKFNDKLTLITGSSKKGKSAIIELVDYVLFSSSNIIPAGVIKDHLDVVILVLEIKREVVSLIRDTETGNMQLISGEFTSNTKINKTKYLKKDIIQDKFEKKLNLYTIDYIKKGSMDQEVVKKYSLRYQVPYNILAQNIIANKDVVFRNFADYKYKKPMKDYFDVYMGIDTPENKYHKLEMTRLEKELKSIEQEIDERNQEYLKRETSILRQLNSLRLSKGLKPLMSTTEVEQEDILLSEKESNFLEKLDDNQLEIELNNLKESKKELIDKKNRLTIENSEIKNSTKIFLNVKRRK